MFKKVLILSMGILASSVALAQNCTSLHSQVMKQSALLTPPWEMKVIGQKGFRAYFHQAPDEKCKIKDLFLIPQDYALAHNGISIKKQEWVYVMYMRKNGSEVYGWMKSKDLKFMGKLGGN